MQVCNRRPKHTHTHLFSHYFGRHPTALDLFLTGGFVSREEKKKPEEEKDGENEVKEEKSPVPI